VRGREGLVPARLGRTHTKRLSPHIGSLSQSILAFVVVLIYVITRQDQFGLLIGNPDSPLRWILPALILVAAIAGVIAASTLKRRSPGCTSRWVGISTLS
jgi:hypothetical protein